MGTLASPRKLVACGSEKQTQKEENNLTHFGHPCKTSARASLRSDNCPTIPDECPTIPDECPTIIGLLSDNFGFGVRNHRNAQYEDDDSGECRKCLFLTVPHRQNGIGSR